MRFRALKRTICVALAVGCSRGMTSRCVAQPAAAFSASSVVNQNGGEDWPWFLGPRHDGTSLEANVLTQWPPDGPPILWAKDVGTGYSAPSVRGNLLVVHHRLRLEEIVECLRADTGESLWKRADPSDFVDPYGYNNGPRCSPLLTEQHCYTLGANGTLNCLVLATGELAWQRQLRADFNIPDGFFGVGASPLLESGKLIVLVGGQPNSGVVAFDPATGETLWQNVGKSTWDGAKTNDPFEPEYEWTGEEMVVSYASPVAATIHGQRHVLCLMRQGLVSLNPETGEERFHYWFRSRAHESVNAACPVVVDDTILLGNAYRVGSVLLRVGATGTTCEVVWSHLDVLATHWSTPVYRDGYFYGFSGRHENEGVLQCVERATGKLLWSYAGDEKLDDLAMTDGALVNRRTGDPAAWPAYGRGSAILVDGKLLVLTERGSLAIGEAGPQGWRELALAQIPGLQHPTWAAPVLAHGRLYLRSEDRLVCVRISSFRK